MYLVREIAAEHTDDPALRLQTREKYAELLTLYMKLKHHVEAPSGTYTSYKAAQRTYEEGLHRLEAHFRNVEGVRLKEE
jgi:hypothetical protein